VTTISKDKINLWIEGLLKDFGQDGWELVAVVDDISSEPMINRLHYFKKPLDE
jgi:hypothetical protein